MFKKAFSAVLFLGLVWAGAPAVPVPVPDFRARGASPAPEHALALRLGLAGWAEVVLERYLDGRRVGQARSHGEGPAVVVFGYGASEGCPLLLVGAVFREGGASSGGACAESGQAREVRLLPTFPDRIEAGGPYPVAWLSFRDARDRLHQAWWLLWWQGR